MKISITFNAAELRKLYSDMEKDGKKVTDRTIEIEFPEEYIVKNNGN